MNKQYIYKDGNVIVADDSGNQKIVKYYDKLDEVLSKKNKIEYMGKKVECSKKIINNLRVDIKYLIEQKKVNFLFLCILGTPIIAAVMFFPLILPLLLAEQVNQILDIFAFLCVFCNVLGASFIVGNNISIKKILKRIKGHEKETEFLNDEIQKEKEVINTLEKEKNNSRENNEFFSVKINDESIYKIDNLSNLYYNLGFHEDKLNKYFQKGKLYYKLKPFYYDSEIEIFEKYFKEKGPVLKKKKK